MNKKNDEKEPTMPGAKIATALSKAQSVMSGAKKNKKNPFFKSSYADLESAFEAVRDPFAENGLAVTQTMDVTPEGRTTLTTRLMHGSGEYIDSTMLLPEIINSQELGKAITYYRRFALMGIAGIPASDDDDGNSTVAAEKRMAKEKAVTPKCTDQEMNEFFDAWSATYDLELLREYVERKSVYLKLDPKAIVFTLMKDQKKFEAEFSKWSSQLEKTEKEKDVPS